MYVTDEILRAAEAALGVPSELELAYEIRPEELAMIRASQRHGRSHDVTTYLFAEGRPEKLAVIAKHGYPPGIYRVPGGGLEPGEALIDGAIREALEETGLPYHVDRYLLRVTALFTCAAERLTWRTHVVCGTGPEREPAPVDIREVREARWIDPAALIGPIAEAMLATQRPLFAYRVALHRAAAAAAAALADAPAR